jgi:hypothetical protein
MGTVESSRKGIEVQKAFDAERFAVPVVVFRVESHRQDTVTVTVSDHLPKPVAANNVKCHPAFDGTHWRATTTCAVEFERRLDPGETVVTLYAVDESPETARTHLRGPPILSAVQTDDGMRQRRPTARRREPAERTGQIAVRRNIGTESTRSAVRDARGERGVADGRQSAAGNGPRFGTDGRRSGRYGSRLRWSPDGVGDAEALGTGDIDSRDGATGDLRTDRSHRGGAADDIGIGRSLPVLGAVAGAASFLFGHLRTYLAE